MSRKMMLIVVAVLWAQMQPAKAMLTWNWTYSSAGIYAAGILTTSDTPNINGFYQILNITGTDNGVTIIGLQPTGTAIPGNEPYAVDNLVSATAPQLTEHGFGFSLANGDYANPFHIGSSYYEYLSSPPYTNGAGLETPISFAASIVPEPSSSWIMLTALAGLIGYHWRGQLSPTRHSP